MHRPQQPSHSTSSSMKENDGRGARRKYMRLAVIVASILGPLLLLAFCLNLLTTNITVGPSTLTALRRRARRHGILKHSRSANDRDWQMTRSVAAEGNNKYNEQDEADNGLEGILDGRLHLMGIRPQRRQHRPPEVNMRTGEYGGIVASFCHIDWSHHKEDPTTSPMFRFLLEKSPGCNDPWEWDLYDIVQKAKEYDASDGKGVVKTLNLTGVVFHESRCGSTLVANLLAAMNPAKHRVYSESSPPISAMRLGDGGGSSMSTVQAAAILKDVVYMMSRSNDAAEERVFFKIQSVGTRSMDVFQAAFPSTPWIFVYRDPVQVIMSHLGKGRPSMANCVRPQSYPPPEVERIVEKYGDQRQHATTTAQDLSYQDFCAAHLASLTEAAVHYMNDYGTPVNYVDLPTIMYTDILPHRWHVPTGPDEIERIQTVSTQYSKQGKGGKPQEFTGDSETKEEAASLSIKQAAQRYLQPSFDELERVAKEKKKLA